MQHVALLLAALVGTRAHGAEPVPITIILEDQFAPAETRAHEALPRAQRREAVVAALKQRYAESSRELLAALEDDGVEVVDHVWIANAVRVVGDRSLVEDLARRGDVARIYVDQRSKQFPRWEGPRDVDPPANSGAVECGVDIIRAPEVWDTYDVTGMGVTVCVVDSGVCIEHPDLEDHIWSNPGEIAGNGVDDDGNGYVDDVNGWNFADDDDDLTDPDNHGTHVAGTAVGDGTNGLKTGVAPDASLMVCKISFTEQAEVWTALQYALDNGADVVNGSIGWIQSVADRPTWRSVTESMFAAGLTLSFAAGNFALFLDPPVAIGCPGDVPDMMTVGATSCADTIAIFSSPGPVTWQDERPYFDWPLPPGKMKPSVSAPGLNICSTSNNCSGYSINSGTSMAAPHVTGAAALVLQVRPDLDHHQVKEILQRSAVDLGDAGWDNVHGTGRIDTVGAVEMAMRDADLNDDGSVDVSDLVLLLAAWGPCDAPPGGCEFDLDFDGDIGVNDLLIVIVEWGR